MKSILLIIPYFGKWPVWFEAFLVSIAKNSTVNWLCPTDCEFPQAYPDNIQFLKTSLESLNDVVNNIVKTNVPLTPRKFCDLKPAYGDIFKDNITGYDFWGFCDMDIICGDIRKFITPDILEHYDIVSSRKEAISGHFTLFRNENKINSLYKRLPNYKQLFEHLKFQWTDEVVLTDYIKHNPEFKVLGLKVYWPQILCNQERGRDSHQEYYLDRWQWQNGKMINTTTHEEVMYLHFINWKSTTLYCEVNYKNKPKSFYVSYNGMHYKPHSKVAKVFNGVKNLFCGYYQYEKYELQKKKYKKRFNRKMKNIFK